MTTEGSDEWFPVPESEAPGPETGPESIARLDSLLPSDAETGAATYDALRTYLGCCIDLMARHGQPMTLLNIAADASDTLRILGGKGALLIGSAIARCLRQETRIHDVIGRAQSESEPGFPSFLIVLPLMTEQLAAQFAERLREQMTMTAGAEGHAWLTLSVGVASLSLDTDAPETLILRAREALSSAQRAGGGRVWSHSDSVRRIIDRDRSGPQEG